MKKIAILFVVFFCSVSLWAQTIEDDATWKLKTDTVRALKHYKAGDNWFIGIQAGANHSLSENSRFGSFGAMTRPSIALSVGKYFSPAIGSERCIRETNGLLDDDVPVELPQYLLIPKTEA